MTSPYAIATERPPRSRLRGILRVMLLLCWTLALVVPVFACWALRCDRTRAALTHVFFRGGAHIVGLRTRASGALSASRPLMLVANHSSYLDVFVLGGRMPVSFTPKREVRSWPVIGFLCVLAGCVFVERKPSAMQEARQQMRKRLNRDHILCLFPEGTTSDNTGVVPFKSGFFSLAESDEGEEPLPVQPVTIAYTHIGTQRMLPHWRTLVAWVGEDTFFDHFWRVLKLPSVTAEVMFHPARTLDEGASRKALSSACESDISASLAQIHARIT